MSPHEKQSTDMLQGFIGGYLVAKDASDFIIEALSELAKRARETEQK